jgi:hypothetical protein
MIKSCQLLAARKKKILLNLMTCDRLQINKTNLVEFGMENSIVLSWFACHLMAARAKNFGYNFPLCFRLHVSSHLLAHLMS